uniref:Beta-ketoacyl synthase n=1 Tax=Solibacter usitatus (strain Ellin6076) TaxID=234267 RepID=Q026V6_SOLUE
MTPLDSQPDPQPEPSPVRGDIAIVGMSCLFAGAPDLDTYWRNIISKVDSVSDPPAGEWDPKIFYDPESKSNDRVYCKRGGYIGDIASFRPLEFGVMPVTVDGGEPDQWLALRVASEALADGGYTELPKEHLRTEVVLGKGTYVNRGNLTVGYHGMIVEHFLRALKNLHPEYTESEIHAIKKELKAGLPPFSADTAPALIGNIIAGRIANRLDLMGPSFTVDAACASALLAIEIGVRDLLSHKYDLVLAGGANVNAPLPTLSLFCQLGALSRGEQIRPFDKQADGTILGEGLGMIVLKRRKDAERDGNRIYAVIKGVGVASDGRAVHVMAPRVEGEELALRRAYEMAGVAQRTVGLIEAHGTATPVGDVVEVQALGRVFGEREGSLPTCAIGSVKSMIGHTMPAAGIAGVIKTALALYHRVLPPTLHCQEPNPALHLERTPFYVNTETRPWIHGAETPRRAGVNSFGFGGINAHVVLEEHPAELPEARNCQIHWETEVCIIEAESRSGLIDRAARLKEYLSQPAVTLKDLAYSLNTRLEGKPSRLAVIASSTDDLAQKLTLAIARLGDPQCSQIKDNGGTYFFDKPLEGKLAFLFPGEGAQYPNLLHDLCLHFPEVRQCFDIADRATLRGNATILPSEFMFPRSILSDTERSEVERALWSLDGAVAAVLIGNWAMWTLLRCLQIRPDSIAGHSTGDYSAMFASSTVEIAREAEVETILEWSKAHSELVERVAVPGATLIAVAADSATVRSIIESIGGDLYLAMDNCPHQSVLVGGKISAAQAIEQLRKQGIIYEILPFDRPYHTPMFQPYAEGTAEAFFARVRVNAPAIETYSCTTASRYPADAEEIRRLFVDHWVGPVRFTETINRMYEDGVRLFVEAGPRGNLTAFVSDILRGRPHLAMPANVARRSGLTQINHLAGVLAAQGVGMRLEYLYARRDPQFIPWESARPSTPAKVRPAAMKLTLALPPLTVSPRAPKAEGAVATARNGSETPVPHRVAPEITRPQASPSNGAPAAVAVAPASIHALHSKASSAAVMQEYFKGMENFLEVETEVMGAFLKRRPATQAASSGTASAPIPAEFPLLGTITALVPGEELTALRQLSQQEDLFLRDHALGGRVSLTDPDLRPLIVLPLTMSMEILAEAGAALMRRQVLVGMRNVQAHHWIQVDDAPVSLQISANRLANSQNEVTVQVRNTKAGPAPVIEGIMIFADDYPTSPPSSALPLAAERRSQLASTDLYNGRLMFHGPAFQGVVSVERSGQNGMTGQLRTLPTRHLFRSIPNPLFVTDPVVLDAAGQLVGFWAAEYLSRGFVVFPYHLDRLTIYGPNPRAGQSLTCRLSVQSTAKESMRSDIEVAGADGAVWMHLQGWADRRFDPPERFHRAWIAPGEAMISEPWPASLKSLPDGESLECRRVNLLFEESGSLWKDLWASLVLTARERGEFAERRGPERRQLEWLAGRTAAKDAVRGFLQKHHAIQLFPADIEITHDEYGRPIARGPWTQSLHASPHVSISHSQNVAVALAYDGSRGMGYGIDLQAIRELAPDFEASVLTGEEQRHLEVVPANLRAEWILRLWCAKEAVSKALGRGLIEGPASVRILALDARTGDVVATPHGKLAAGVPEAAGRKLSAFTMREGAFVFATAIFEKRTS